MTRDAPGVNPAPCCPQTASISRFHARRVRQKNTSTRLFLSRVFRAEESCFSIMLNSHRSFVRCDEFCQASLPVHAWTWPLISREWKQSSFLTLALTQSASQTPCTISLLSLRQVFKSEFKRESVTLYVVHVDVIINVAFMGV